MPVGHVVALVAAGLFLVGVLLVGLGVRMLAVDRRRNRTWHAYPGRVVASRWDGDQTRCQVVYRRDGTDVLFWNRYTSTVVGDPVGRPVQVLVNPADAREAVVGSGLVTGTTIGVVLVLVGGFFCVVGAFISLVALS
jgi:hypothetical protein